MRHYFNFLSQNGYKQTHKTNIVKTDYFDVIIFN